MKNSSSMTVMDPVDRAWLQMDEPGNPMVISAVFQLDGPVDAAAFQQTLVERLLSYPRFRQRVGTSGGAPCWIFDDEQDFSYHVRVQRLPEADYERQLRKAISAEVSHDLDRERPLWRLLLYPRRGGPITVLFRAHHAMADGIALVTLLIDSTDAGAARARPRVCRAGSHPRGGPLGRLIDRLELLNHGLDRIVPYVRELSHPLQLSRRVRQGRATLAAVKHLLGLPANKPPALDQPLSGRRAVAWTDGIPFAPVRRLAHELDMRVNDIFMSLLAGAFGRLLPDVSDLRVSIPVNLRNGRGRDLGNQFGLVLLDLPIGVRDPLQRLHLISERMAFLKASLEAKVTLFGLAAAGHLPMPLEKRLVSLLGARSSAVVSNLPGPRRHVTLAGARMRNLVFWPPQAGGIGIGVSFFTYAGEFSIGVCADRNLLSSPSRLVAAMREELHLLCRHGRGKGGVHGRAAIAAAP